MRISRLAGIAALLAVPSLGYAQYPPPPPSPGTVGGAVGGAVIGGAVGGPVGAVVGGALGAGVGSQTGAVPSALPPAPPVAYNGPIAVGAKIPRDGSVPTYFIPNYSHRYAYTNLDGHEVIVNRRTARIVQVMP